MTWETPPLNPYDPTIPDYKAGTQPHDQSIRDAVRGGLLQARFMMPGQVTKIVGPQQINVQPLFQQRYIDGTVSPLPELQNVPVQYPSGQNYCVKLPVAVNDTGMLIFSDRSLDAWLAGSGGIVDPSDSRIHDLADAVFVPGMVPFSGANQDVSSNLVITNGGAQMTLEPGGKFKFSGNGSQEIMNLINQLITNLNNLYTVLTTEAFTLTLLGPQPFIASTVSALQQYQQALQQIQSDWEELQG